jgi:dolichol kinase
MNFSEELKEEIKRKGGRLIVGTLLIIYAVYLKNTYGVEILKNAFFFLTLLAIFQNYLRVDLQVPIPLYDQLLKRPSERIGLHGSTLGAIGCLLAVIFFDFDIAYAAISMYIYGDAAAGIIGKGFGTLRFHHGKSLKGSLAMLVVSIMAGFLFLNNIFLIMAMAIIATLLEMFVVQIPDDLILPIFTALFGQLLAAALGLRPFIKGWSFALMAWVFVASALTIFFLSTALYKKLRK